MEEECFSIKLPAHYEHDSQAHERVATFSSVGGLRLHFDNNNAIIYLPVLHRPWFLYRRHVNSLTTKDRRGTDGNVATAGGIQRVITSSRLLEMQRPMDGGSMTEQNSIVGECP